MPPRLIVFLVIIAFSVIKALINSAQEKAKAEQLRQRQVQVGAPNRQRTVQSEIDAFLNDTRTPQKSQQTESIQARERRERRRREAEVKKRDGERKRLQEGMPKTRRPLGKNIGSGIGKHVDQFINKHVDEYLDHDVDEYVEATIIDNVESNLGRRSLSPAPTTTTRRNKSAESVVALLKDPVGVRNAILINEILSRPRALDR